MSYLIRDTKTVTLSTLGAGTGYTTALNGLIQSVYVSISKAIGASGKVTITNETTSRGILIVADPSTLGGLYYPRAKAHGTTGAVFGTSAPVFMNLVNDRVKIKVATSSGLSGQTVTVNVETY